MLRSLLQDSTMLIHQLCWTATLQQQRLSRRLLETPHGVYPGVGLL